MAGADRLLHEVLQPPASSVLVPDHWRAIVAADHRLRRLLVEHVVAVPPDFPGVTFGARVVDGVGGSPIGFIKSGADPVRVH